MLTRNVLISTIFMSIFVYTSVSAQYYCNDDVHPDADKLKGYWYNVARVSISPDTSQCGHFFLKNENAGKFSGYWYRFDPPREINLTLTARLVHNTFELSFEDLNGLNTGVPLRVIMCGGYLEFVLENKQLGHYHILSRNTSASDMILFRYQLLANNNHLQFTKHDNSNCSDVNTADYS